MFIELDFRVRTSWKGNDLIKFILKERIYECATLRIKFCYSEDQKTTQILVLDIT